MRLFILAAAAAALAACGRQDAETYPPQYELNFMRACQAQSAPAGFCACTWEKIEREIAADDFAAFERLPPGDQQTHPLRQQIQRYADECRTEAVEPPDDPPPP